MDRRIGKYRNKGDGMVRQSLRIALLVGTVAALGSAAPARAQCCDQPAPTSCCQPATRTICVTECVPETYTTKRITYKTEQRIEKYTAYKCVPTTECRERVCTVYKQVPEWREECRKVCVKVPCCEERTVMKPCYHTVTETKMVTKCVDRGHYECREVYSPCKAFCNGLSGLCHRHNDCDPCNPPPCPPSNCVTRKVWVPCMVQECCPVTCCRKVCEMRPEVIKVNTCRTEWREEKVKVCSYRCVPEQQVQKYTVCIMQQVPYEATRCVSVCVPCEETVTCTRMVAKTVLREVPCAPTTDCCSSPCCGSGHGGHRLFSGFGGGCGGCGGHRLFSGFGHGGHGGGCATGGCAAGCGCN
jgi:hypothetical protein